MTVMTMQVSLLTVVKVGSTHVRARAIAHAHTQARARARALARAHGEQARGPHTLACQM